MVRRQAKKLNTKKCYAGKLKPTTQLVDDLCKQFTFTDICAGLNEKLGEKNLVFAGEKPAKHIAKVVLSGKQTVVLIFFRSNSRYWHDLVFPNVNAIWLINDHIQFQGYDAKCQFPYTLMFFNFPKKETNRILCPKIDTIGGYPFTSIRPVNQNICSYIKRERFTVGSTTITKKGNKFILKKTKSKNKRKVKEKVKK